MMERAKKWTKERCFEEALKYDSKGEWMKCSRRSYDAAYAHNWLNECSLHMVKKYWVKWTKEKCIEEARNYQSKLEWFKMGGGYGRAKENGWFEECTAHMLDRRLIKTSVRKPTVTESKKRYSKQPEERIEATMHPLLRSKTKPLKSTEDEYQVNLHLQPKFYENFL